MSIEKMIANSVVSLYVNTVGRLFLYKNQFINVIYYHDIVKTNGEGTQKLDISKFISQMTFLMNEEYEKFTFDELNTKSEKFGKKKILITIDDGWKSNFTEIFEFMRENGLKYNVFLAVGLIGNDSDYITWDMARKMHQSGIVGFGVHTYNHVEAYNLTTAEEKIEHDLAINKFKSEMGFRPTDFCYPFGFYSEKSNQRLIETKKYHRIYTCDRDFSYEKDDVVVFGRNAIDNGDDMKCFSQKVSGLYNSICMVKKTKNRKEDV